MIKLDTLDYPVICSQINKAGHLCYLFIKPEKGVSLSKIIDKIDDAMEVSWFFDKEAIVEDGKKVIIINMSLVKSMVACGSLIYYFFKIPEKEDLSKCLV